MTSKRKNSSRPGNTVAEQQLFDRVVYSVGVGWLEVANAIDGLLDDGIIVKRISLKGDWRVEGDMLIVVTADGPDGPVVGFHGVDAIQYMWAGLARRLASGQIEWRKDEYAG